MEDTSDLPQDSAPEPEKPRYEEAKRAFEAAWRALDRCVDAPDDQEIALLGLRTVLPMATRQKLMHNYRYREVAASAQFNARINAQRKSVHGADCQARIDIEIKTGTLKTNKARLITPSAGVGMFDKIHTRVSSPITVKTDMLAVAIEKHEQRETGAPASFTIGGETWRTDGAVEKIKKALDEAVRAGLENTRIPTILKPDRLTSSPLVETINFCLFSEGGVDPLLTVETTTGDLESHLSSLFEGAGKAYQDKMSGRSTEKAPSAHDGVVVRICHLMGMGNAARVVCLDTRALSQQDLWLDEEVLTWVQKAGTPEVKDRLARMVARRKEQAAAQSHSGRGPRR